MRQRNQKLSNSYLKKSLYSLLIWATTSSDAQTVSDTLLATFESNANLVTIPQKMIFYLQENILLVRKSETTVVTLAKAVTVKRG